MIGARKRLAISLVGAALSLGGAGCSTSLVAPTVHEAPDECFPADTNPNPAESDDVNPPAPVSSPWWALVVQLPTDPACGPDAAEHDGHPTDVVWSEAGALHARSMVPQTRIRFERRAGRCEITVARGYSDPLSADSVFPGEFDIEVCPPALIDTHAASYATAGDVMLDTLEVERGPWLSATLPVRGPLRWTVQSDQASSCVSGPGAAIDHMTGRFRLKLSVDLRTLERLHSRRGFVSLRVPVRLRRH